MPIRDVFVNVLSTAAVKRAIRQGWKMERKAFSVFIHPATKPTAPSRDDSDRRLLYLCPLVQSLLPVE